MPERKFAPQSSLQRRRGLKSKGRPIKNTEPTGKQNPKPNTFKDYLLQAVNGGFKGIKQREKALAEIRQINKKLGGKKFSLIEDYFEAFYDKSLEHFERLPEKQGKARAIRLLAVLRNARTLQLTARENFGMLM